MNGITLDFNGKKSEVYISEVFSSLKKIDFNGRKIAIFASKFAENFVISLSDELKGIGGDVYSYISDDGEKVKTIQKAMLFSEFLSLNNFDRKSLIINIGGGTICDLGGFVASVYMRGIDYINIPTTLLCAVDACIGGKTAVDGIDCKNLWGTFYQPTATIIDSELIKKGGDKVLDGGISEIVKYGVINRKFGEKLLAFKDKEEIYSRLEEIICDCVKIKSVYIVQDEKDLNVRHALNLGHTVAHALESQSKYTLTHAEAVANGLFAESKLALSSHLLSQKNYDSIYELCLKFLGAYDKKIDIESLIPYMQKDKKNEGGDIIFSLPTDSGIISFALKKEEVISLFNA